MTPRSRAQDLTADLLHDLAATAPEQDVGDAAEAAPPPRRRSAPFVQATLFPAPRSWRRPRVSRRDGALTVAAGPVQLRVGAG